MTLPRARDIVGGLTLTVTVLYAACLLASNAPDVNGVEPPVRLQGILCVGDFIGPPGYGEDPSKDSSDPSYYLQLPTPIQTQQPQLTSSADLKDALDRTAYFVQLVIYSEQQPSAKKLIGKRVEISGTLFEAFTGHHRTPLVAEVGSLRAVTRWRWNPGEGIR